MLGLLLDHARLREISIGRSIEGFGKQNAIAGPSRLALPPIIQFNPLVSTRRRGEHTTRTTASTQAEEEGDEEQAELPVKEASEAKDPLQSVLEEFVEKQRNLQETSGKGKYQASYQDNKPVSVKRSFSHSVHV